jgi:single stranded DNA-binding protein
MSKVTAVGHIAADAELRTVGKGKDEHKVADFRFCANVYRGKDFEDTPVWYKTALWNKYAEVMVDRLKKGTQVMVTGDLVVEEYEKDGEKRFVLVILNADVIVGAAANSGGDDKKKKGSENRFPRD